MECVRAAKSFGSSLAVDGVSFAVEQGEIVGFLGPSGSGKTTLLRLIAGFETVSAGEVRIAGRTVSGPSDHVPPERRNVGVVFQEYALFPHLTALENVEFGLGSLPRPERKRRGQSALELVRLDGMEQRYPHELSGGEQQRVALARTLAPRPVTILLDEPFSNLDAAMKSEMRREVGEILKESGTTAVFVTHDREEAFAMADRVAVLQRGRLEQIDSPSALYHSPATPFVARATGACDFLPGRTQGGRAHTDIGSLAVTDPVGAFPRWDRGRYPRPRRRPPARPRPKRRLRCALTRVPGRRGPPHRQHPLRRRSPLPPPPLLHPPNRHPRKALPRQVRALRGLSPPVLDHQDTCLMLSLGRQL